MTAWREKLAPLIATVMSEKGKDDMRKLRKALRKACPVKPPPFYPYHIWLDEINVQLGIKQRRGAAKSRQALVAAGQMELEM